MKIGVLSDTHIQHPDEARSLADFLLAGPFSDVEAILHAGDVVIGDLEDYFAPLPWFAVRGNMDHSLTDVPISRVVLLAGRKIGLIHGWGSRHDIEQRVLRHFIAEPLDALVFGHSHSPVCKMVGSVLLFNPGSATDKRSAAQHTVGVLNLAENIRGEIIAIE